MQTQCNQTPEEKAAWLCKVVRMIVFVLWNDSSQTWYAKKILKMFFQIKILLNTSSHMFPYKLYDFILCSMRVPSKEESLKR